MTGLFGAAPKPPAPAPIAPPPQIDDAQARLNEQERMAKRQGRKATILTGDSGLPNLGTTTTLGS